MATDWTTYTDAELAALRNEINTETLRRAQLRALPDQARQAAVDYMALGGDTAVLIAAINEAASAPEVPLPADKTPSLPGGAQREVSADDSRAR